MSDVLDYRIFARVAATGSQTEAARQLGLSSSVISKRLTRLEERMAVRLLRRTTRRLSLTEEGRAFYEQISAALTLIEEAEAAAAGGATRATGVLKVTAPTAFARLHIAPRLKELLDAHPDLKLNLTLSDEVVDLVGTEIDVAVRIGTPPDSSLIARRLAPNRRFLCGAPSYIERYGTPETLADLSRHRLLAASSNIRWRLEGPEGVIVHRPISVVETNSSEVVREMVVSGAGIGLRSTWDVTDELKRGALVRVLPQYVGARDVAIYAMYVSRRFTPLKIRAFIDFLSRLYGATPYWDEGVDVGG